MACAEGQVEPADGEHVLAGRLVRDVEVVDLDQRGLPVH